MKALLRSKCFLLLSLLLVPFTGARAEVERVVAKSSGTMGVYRGREYIYVMADMHGTVARDGGATGRYRVPVILMYPDRDGNGFGFVDLPNSAAFFAYHEGEAPGGKRSVYHLGDMIFSDYLRREGYVYLSVQWARMVTYVLGEDYGLIEDARDNYPIIKDAAALLRAPIDIQGEVAFQPPAVRRVIGYGHSQTAFLQWSFVHAGENRGADGSLVFDGMLAAVGPAGGACMQFHNDATPREPPAPPNPWFRKVVECPGHLPQDGKYMALLTQSDVDTWSGHLDRRQSKTYRQYELAGVAHIPPDMIDMQLQGATRQNPVSFKPFFKAALRNLHDWIADGTPPPDSTYIDGREDAAGKFQYATDADGNVTGGVRLPHMPRVLAGGEPAGAPLGVYGGVEPDMPNGFDWLSGTFEPFSADELARRYPSDERYVERVGKAAAALLEERFILKEDHDAYIKAARYWRR